MYDPQLRSQGGFGQSASLAMGFGLAMVNAIKRRCDEAFQVQKMRKATTTSATHGTAGQSYAVLPD
jgi:hypothetical protein